jgi:hypothetical protein
VQGMTKVFKLFETVQRQGHVALVALAPLDHVSEIKW